MAAELSYPFARSQKTLRAGRDWATEDRVYASSKSRPSANQTDGGSVMRHDFQEAYSCSSIIPWSDWGAVRATAKERA